MTETPKQSDQLPEEGPPEQIPDDRPRAGEGAARESGERAAADAQERDTTGRDRPTGGRTAVSDQVGEGGGR